jgi:ABC-2 type transport system ATP-binding protein
MDTIPIIQVEGLTKDFYSHKRYPGPWGGIKSFFSHERDTIHAVDHINFTIGKGEFIGYIGPNGAGKSTTIKLLTGILVPTAGNVQVAGLTPWKQRERNARNIGVVFGQRTQLWWDLPLIESFTLMAQFYGVSPSDLHRRLEEFNDRLGINDFIHRPVRQLSSGQRMLGDLVAAMLYDPPLLYLDEPTMGLDVLAKEQIRLFLEEINRTEQTTIILTTHEMADIERLCNHILLIDHGKILFDGPPNQLKKKYSPQYTLVIHLNNASPVQDISEAHSPKREYGMASI